MRETVIYWVRVREGERERERESKREIPTYVRKQHKEGFLVRQQPEPRAQSPEPREPRAQSVQSLENPEPRERSRSPTLGVERAM